MKSVVFLLAATLMVWAVESSPQGERRRPNPDLVVLQDFVRELREASRGRESRDASSEESDERRADRRAHRRYKYAPLIVASTTTTTPHPNPDSEIAISEVHHKPRPSASTEKYIPRYSPPPHKRISYSPTSTEYPPPSTTYRYRPPYDLNMVNDGVSTILRGVGSARLSEILRGSFMFTRNGQVRDVANNVIDSIFGPRDPYLAKAQTRDAGIFPLSAF